MLLGTVLNGLGFLSSQGGSFTDREDKRQPKPGRPVLQHTKKSPFYMHASNFDRIMISAKQMRDQLGFKVEKFVHFVTPDQCLWCWRRLTVEVLRFWRHPNAGAKYEEPDEDLEICNTWLERFLIRKQGTWKKMGRNFCHVVSDIYHIAFFDKYNQRMFLIKEI